MGRQNHTRGAKRIAGQVINRVLDSNIDPDFEKKLLPQGPWILGKFLPSKLESSLIMPDTVSKMLNFKMQVLKLGAGVAEVRPDIQVGDCLILDSQVPPIQIGRIFGYDTTDGTELFLYHAANVPAVIRELPAVLDGELGAEQGS